MDHGGLAWSVTNQSHSWADGSYGVCGSFCFLFCFCFCFVMDHYHLHLLHHHHHQEDFSQLVFWCTICTCLPSYGHFQFWTKHLAMELAEPVVRGTNNHDLEQKFGENLWYGKVYERGRKGFPLQWKPNQWFA